MLFEKTPLLGQALFTRRLRMNICLHRADDNLACLFVFTHEPLVLFIGDHFARLEPD
jgi:hypothetical protein